MKNIGIQFSHEAISVAHYTKNKLVGATVSGEVSYEALKEVMKKAGLSVNGNYNVVFSVPQENVEINTLHSIPTFKNIKNRKMLRNESIEKLLSKSSEDHYISVVDEPSARKNMLDVAIVDIKHTRTLAHVAKFEDFKNVQLCAIDISSEALRTIVGNEDKNVVIINFYDSDKRNVGIYIYKGKFIIGARHLILDLYSYEEIREEIDRALGFSKTKYRDYKPEMYFAFGKSEELENIKQHVKLEENSLSESSLAVAAGLAKKENYTSGFNLLPEKYKKKSIKFVYNIIMFFYFVIIALLSLYTYSNYKNDADITKKLSDLKNVISIEKIEKDTLQMRLDNDPDYELLKIYIEEEKKLLTEREWIDYSDFVATISQIVTDISFSSFEIYLQRIKSDEGAVTLEGQSKSYDALNMLFNKLKEVEKINNVKLEKMEVKVEEGIIVYAIKCDIDYKW